MRIAIGGDHAGYQYKKEIIQYLESKKISVIDFGPFSDQSCDYPDFAHPLAISVEKAEVDFGILICGSANGVAITANKHQGIRAALCWQKEIAVLSRSHNNANVICIPARFMALQQVLEMIQIFIDTKFEGGRHQDRVFKISC